MTEITKIHKNWRKVFIRLRYLLSKVESKINARDFKPMIKHIGLNNSGSQLIGAEIGVYHGETTRAIFEAIPMKKMYCIDPYIPYHDLQLRHNQKQLNKDGEIAKKRLKPFIDKIVFLEMKSEDAVKEIDEELDFVYIDGNHNYEFVKKDIELYYPKVKNGGIIGGHDYSSQYFGVVHAVNEFVDKYGLNISGKQEDWWIKK